MFKKVFLGFSVFFSLNAFAGTVDHPARNESVVCHPTTLQNAGPLCCDTLPGKSCEETLEGLLTSQQKTFLQQLTQVILDFPAEKTNAPSCFATSMVLAGMPVADPFSYGGDTELVTNLAKSFKEVSEKEMQKGDILLFEERGDYFYIDEDERGHRIFFWGTGTPTLSHAMMYLGDGLVVQKENSFTAVSTVSTLERSYATYALGLEKQQHEKTQFYAHKKTKLFTRVFRKI